MKSTHTIFGSPNKQKKMVNSKTNPPPTKTPKASLPISELLKTLDEVEKVETGKALKLTEVTEIIPALFLVCREILGKLDLLVEQKQELEGKNVQLNKDVVSLKSRICELEYSKCRNSIRIDGLQLNESAKDGRETPSQSVATVEKLLDDLGVSDCSFVDCWRTQKSKPGPSPPTMIVDFFDHSHHSRFFGSLKNLKGLKNEYKIYVNQQYPFSLVERNKELNAAAKARRRQRYHTMGGRPRPSGQQPPATPDSRRQHSAALLPVCAQRCKL